MILQILKRLLIFDDKDLKLANGREVRQYMRKALWTSLACLALAVNYLGLRVLPMVTVSFLAGAVVEIIFSRVRKKTVSGGTLVFSILLVLMLPPGIPLWMLAAGSAFGILFGKEVFGGTGNHIFHPVLISKGFLMFSYPKVVKGTYFGSMLEFSNPNAWLTCCILILIGGIVMVFVRKSNLLIILSILFSGIVLGLILNTKGYLPYDSIVKLIAADGFLFGICFLACDPSISPRGSIGKLIYGLLIGMAAVLMRCFSNYSEAMLSAILLGNLFTPTIDAVSLLKKEKEKPVK